MAVGGRDATGYAAEAGKEGLCFSWRVENVALRTASCDDGAQAGADLAGEMREEDLEEASGMSADSVRAVVD